MMQNSIISVTLLAKMSLGACVMLALSSSNALAQQDKPASMQPHENQSVTGAGRSPSFGDLKAWANNDAWTQLEHSRWIPDGSSKAPRIVYVFTDPNCPFCNKLWGDSRPWIDSDKVQLRHILLGILSPTSAGKAAAILTDSNPSMRLKNHERGQMQAGAQILASGNPSAMGDSVLKPLSEIPPAISAQLASNAQMMQSFGLAGTPGIVWQDSRGKLQMRMGAPTSLEEIWGPK